MADIKTEFNMEEITNEVKQLFQLHIVCLTNSFGIISEVQCENIILEALTGAYIAGITKGINLSKEIEKEFNDKKQ